MIVFYSEEVLALLRYSQGIGNMEPTEEFRFFGPPSPLISDDQKNPVQFTRPYFDCGRSNRWIVSAVAPILDVVPRYLYDLEVPGLYEALRRKK